MNDTDFDCIISFSLCIYSLAAINVITIVITTHYLYTCSTFYMCTSNSYYYVNTITIV